MNQNIDGLSADMSDFTGNASDGDMASPYPLRELQGLDRALRTLRSSRAVQESKRVALQQTIEEFRENIEKAGDNQEAHAFAEREIEKAHSQLEPIEESIRVLNGRLRSQVVQIRDSLRQLLDRDQTLGERVRTLFREQGVTIASILTAIGLAISTLVTALTGEGGAAPPTPPNPPSGGVC